MRSHPANALALLVVSTLSANAHTVLHRFEGFTPNSYYGTSCGIGDANGDGYGDLLVSAFIPGPNFEQYGTLYVYSGFDGSPIRVVQDTSLDSLGHYLCAPGDVDGDGLDDFTAGAWPDQGVYTYSSATGLLIHRIAPPGQGDFLDKGPSPIEDLDGDGVGDLLLAGFSVLMWDAYSTTVQEGMVWAFSGATGNLIREYPGTVTTRYWHHDQRSIYSNVAALGDIDGDGVSDLVAGSSYSEAPVHAHERGLVRVISGGTGAIIRQDQGPPQARYGQMAGSAGDWDGDGTPDYYYSESVPTGFPRVPTTEAITIFSGLDGSALQVIVHEQPTRMTYSSAANVGDVDGDGKEDLGLTASQPSPSLSYPKMTCEIRAGGSGMPLFHSGAPVSRDNPFGALAAAGDVNADGIVDVVASGVNDGALGSATVFSVVPIEIGYALCTSGSWMPCPCSNDPLPGDLTGCLNSTGSGAMMRGFGANLLATDRLELSVSKAPPGELGIVVGLAGNMADMAPFGDGLSCLGTTPLRLDEVTLDPHGEAWVTLELSTTIGSYGGMRGNFQLWYRDPGGPCGNGFNTSNVVRIQP